MGSRNKYEYDPAFGATVLDRRLFTSMSYPADYGFIEGTLVEDGDPLDALVLVGDLTFPSGRICARPVGVSYMTDEKGSDEKIICTSLHNPAWLHVHEIDDLQPEYRDEIEHFFKVYKDLEKKKTATEGFGDRSEEIAVIEAARLRAREACT
jgi:inorganic pyrophosphatase